jgi:hypothetical protein
VALIQTVVVLAIVVIGGGAFYAWRSSVLDAEAATPDSSVSSAASGSEAVGSSQPTAAGSPAVGPTYRPSPLGDMTSFIVITQDTLALVNSGDHSGATSRITDLESAWDNSAAALQRRDKNEWHAVDDKIDAVLRELRSTSPDPSAEKQALQSLLTQMGA